MSKAAVLTWLALGDSYTIGEGIDSAGRWPEVLARALRAEGVPLGDPRIIAATGWTTDELDAAIDAADPPPPDDHALVSLLIGVNNQYRGRSVDDYLAQFSALVDRATGFAGDRPGRVMVLSIPDWGVTPFAAEAGHDPGRVAAAIDAFNAAAAAACRARGVAFIDITTCSRTGGGNPDMLATDQLHPSAPMHTRWAQLALPVARSLLASEAD